MSENTEILFKKGDLVAYPTNGVGKITEIVDKVIFGKTMTYYNIFFPSQNMNILLPVQNAEETGLRALASEDEIKAAVASLSVEKKVKEADWKTRQLKQMTLMKEGSIENIALIVNILYHRQKVRDLPIQERRIFDTALQQLTDEARCVLGLEEEKVRRAIFTRLEKIGK